MERIKPAHFKSVEERTSQLNWCEASIARLHTELTDTNFLNFFILTLQSLAEQSAALKKNFNQELIQDLKEKITNLESVVAMVKNLESLQKKLSAEDLEKLPFSSYFEDITLKLRRLAQLEESVSFSTFDTFPEEKRMSWDNLFDRTTSKIEDLKKMIDFYHSPEPQNEDQPSNYAKKIVSRRPPLLATHRPDGAEVVYTSEIPAQPLVLQGDLALPEEDGLLTDEDRRVIHADRNLVSTSESNIPADFIFNKNPESGVSQLSANTDIQSLPNSSEPAAPYIGVPDHIFAQNSRIAEISLPVLPAVNNRVVNPLTDRHALSMENLVIADDQPENTTDMPVIQENNVPLRRENGFNAWYNRNKKTVLSLVSAAGLALGIKIGSEISPNEQNLTPVVPANSQMQTETKTERRLTAHNQMDASKIRTEVEPSPINDMGAILDQSLKGFQDVTIAGTIKGKRQVFNKKELVRYYVDHHINSWAKKQSTMVDVTRDGKTGQTIYLVRPGSEQEFKEKIVVPAIKKVEKKLKKLGFTQSPATD